MKSTTRTLSFRLFAILMVVGATTGLVAAGCSSGGDGGSGTGGQVGSGGAPGATGGSPNGSGGNTGLGGGPSGGGGVTAGTGGGAGGASSGSGGAAAGTGGAAAGTGGAAGRTAGGGSPANGGRSGAAGQSASVGGASGQGGRSALTLSSASLTAGGTFMPPNTCAGVNQSPPLAWTAGPAATASYAVVLVDTSITRYHWAIWNLASTVRSLPEALPTGATITAPVDAMQAVTGTAAPMYQGPCPNGTVHTYVFTVYALDVATLPGIASGAMAQAVYTAIQSHVLASGTLSGTSSAVRAQ